MNNPTPRQPNRAVTSAVNPGNQGAKTADILGRQHLAPPPSEPIPEQWRWHYRTLQSLQSRLGQDRNDLRRAAAEPMEPHSLDEADSATDELDHDLALAQLSAEQDALFEVNEALQRIRDGRYGICEETGQAIPAERLKAVPWTRFTRGVQEELEKAGVIGRVHLNKPSTVRGSTEVSFVPAEEAVEAAAEAAEAEEPRETGPGERRSSDILSELTAKGAPNAAGKRPSENSK